MDKPKGNKSKISQYVLVSFFAIMTIGAFENFILSGCIMLLATLMAWPVTRNLGVKLLKRLIGDKIQTDKIKGWMYISASIFLVLIALMISPSNETNSATQLIESEIQLETEETLEIKETELEKDIVKQETGEEEKEDDTLETDAEKEALVDESDLLKVNSNQKQTLLVKSNINSVSEPDTKADLVQIPEIESEQKPETESIQQPEPIPEEQPESIPESISELASVPEAESDEPIATTSSETRGSYAVNGKNGKIHIVGECPATGTGDNAMTSPVYFNTYEEAETYSISIKANLEKRRCGNCW